MTLHKKNESLAPGYRNLFLFMSNENLMKFIKSGREQHENAKKNIILILIKLYLLIGLFTVSVVWNGIIL